MRETLPLLAVLVPLFYAALWLVCRRLYPSPRRGTEVPASPDGQGTDDESAASHPPRVLGHAEACKALLAELNRKEVNPILTARKD
jgi:hypothetical protein